MNYASHNHKQKFNILELGIHSGGAHVTVFQ